MMMLRTRILPAEEWPRLQGTELESVWPTLHPEHASVLVVEDDEGAIVGTWAIIHVLCAEGLWIAPAHRGRAAVGRRLWAGMRTLLRGLHARGVITSSMSPSVDRLFAHVPSQKLPGTQYVVTLNNEGD
jgi:hypothetical protein